jgi:hypothetical protein
MAIPPKDTINLYVIPGWGSQKEVINPHKVNSKDYQGIQTIYELTNAVGNQALLTITEGDPRPVYTVLKEKYMYQACVRFKKKR